MSNPLLLREFVEKLPPFIGLKWAEYLMTHSIRNPDLNHFSDWVKESSRIIVNAGLMNRGRVVPMPIKSPNINGEKIYVDSKAYNKNASLISKFCKFCKKEDHPASMCEAFRKMDVKQRWREAENHKLCYRCLGKHSRYD